MDTQSKIKEKDKHSSCGGGTRINGQTNKRDSSNENGAERASQMGTKSGNRRASAEYPDIHRLEETLYFYYNN